MRFYRFAFWIAFIVHIVFGGWFCLTPELAKSLLHGGYTQIPLLYFQEHGLFMVMQACGYAYVAERPQKSIPVVALSLLVNACLPLFALQASTRGDIGPFMLIFQLALSGVMLPFLISYVVWFYHVPRPDRFMPLMGIFGTRK